MVFTCKAQLGVDITGDDEMAGVQHDPNIVGMGPVTDGGLKGGEVGQ